MVSRQLRTDLPPLPAFIQRLPVHRGYPVPWFVTWIDGVPEFRIADAEKLHRAVRERRCWVCGERLYERQRFAFVVGPMCAVNRISSEPPSHIDCARFSAEACPFLSRPHMVRREGGLPEQSREPAGLMIRRNPGVALMWTTDSYSLRQLGRGRFLIVMGRPIRWKAYAEGREATKDELRTSVETGLPILREQAAKDGPRAEHELQRQVIEACRMLGIGMVGAP